jgi:uncharacterized protein (DUF58 family)
MITSDEARQLDRFAIGAGGGAASAAGRRAIGGRGLSLEFHDYRPYQPGDDPRSIDWNIDARLRQLVVRMFRAEGHVPLHLLVDSSASMRFGASRKIDVALRAAAALSYVAVLRRDPVAFATFDTTVRTHLAATAGRTQLFRLFEAARDVRASGRSDLDRSLTDYGTAVRGPGLAVVFSDFFDSAARLDGVRYLMYRGFVVALVQVLAPEELEPQVLEDADLVDLEHPDARPLRVDAAVVTGYLERLSQLTGRLQTFCRGQGLPFVRLVSSDPFATIVGAYTGAGLLELHA